MALTGGMVMPWVTGVLGGRYGLRTSFLVVPAALVGVAVLLTLVSGQTARAEKVRA